MLPGFRSRCTMPRACACSSPCAHLRRDAHAPRAIGRRWSSRLHRSAAPARRPPCTGLTMYGSTRRVVSSPVSNTVTMFGWSPSRPIACASRCTRASAVGVEPFRLDRRERHVAVELGVVRQVDALAPALAEEATAPCSARRRTTSAMEAAGAGRCGGMRVLAAASDARQFLQNFAVGVFAVPHDVHARGKVAAALFAEARVARVLVGACAADQVIQSLLTAYTACVPDRPLSSTSRAVANVPGSTLLSTSWRGAATTRGSRRRRPCRRRARP